MAVETSPESTTSSIDGIVIRPYHDFDREGVHSVFRAGMESLVPEATRLIVTAPAVSVALAALSGFAGILARRTLGKAAGYVAAIGTVLAGGGYIYRFTQKLLDGYITKSIESDLSQIEQVYGKKGRFLVAVDTTDGNRIVGHVAGEPKEDGVYELRRMSVVLQRQRSGLGKRLIQQLEADLQPRRMYLTCSSAQYAAHRLYERMGFQLKERLRQERYGWLLGQAVEGFVYDKMYGEAQ